MNRYEEIAEAAIARRDAASLLAEKVDKAPWMYSGVHTVQLIAGHEGYDAAGVNALVSFLPFKPVRLGSLLGDQQYSSYIYVAGRPRLSDNAWRLDALKLMNAAILRQGRMIDISTFGYRDSLHSLADLICGSEGLLREFDVHLAPMGSKLQNLSCWILSSLIPAITMITSVPDTWHPNAFSHKVGQSWVFPFKIPT